MNNKVGSPPTARAGKDVMLHAVCVTAVILSLGVSAIHAIALFVKSPPLIVQPVVQAGECR